MRTREDEEALRTRPWARSLSTSHCRAPSCGIRLADRRPMCNARSRRKGRCLRPRAACMPSHRQADWPGKRFRAPSLPFPSNRPFPFRSRRLGSHPCRQFLNLHHRRRSSSYSSWSSFRCSKSWSSKSWYSIRPARPLLQRGRRSPRIRPDYDRSSSSRASPRKTLRKPTNFGA